MTPPDAPVTSFDFRSGALRGSHLVLYPVCLVHRGDNRLETIPIAAIASLRIGFEREARALRWAVVLVALALTVSLLSSPFASLAGAAADEVVAHLHSEASAQTMAAMLVSLFRGMETAARLLPVLGGALGAWGAALAALGWMGLTTLTLTLGAAERAYAVRGRSAPLFDFTEALSEHMLKARR